jgi:hypothetical protein
MVSLSADVSAGVADGLAAEPLVLKAAPTSGA